jgi:glutathione S-transferase
MLAFVATELHKPFVRAFFPTSDAEKQAAEETLRKRLGFVASGLKGDYLFGREVSVADAYLYVMLRWARMKELKVPAPLQAYLERMEARPAVRLALQHEGLA